MAILRVLNDEANVEIFFLDETFYKIRINCILVLVF